VPNESARHVAIEAKYLRPRHDRVSVRPDARSAFAAAFERRLTVVCAPAGYGKTTTTAALLEQCGRPAAWYKLDVLDHDPLAFLAAMTRAVRRLHPGFGTALLGELESGPVLDLPPQVLAAQFCSECDRLVTAPGHLVLDDYHETMDALGMNEVFGYLLENCPETIHFVVLSRYEPAFRLEKLRLAGEVSRIPRELLLFDESQVAEVLQQRSGRPHDAEFVASIATLTEGWPASVVLAGMSLEWLDPTSLEDALTDPRLRMDVFSYLAEQVFQRQTAEVQRFLLRTCCFDHVSAELAERVSSSGSASRHLHFLARNHVFTFDTGRKGTYRYHNLLRDFLRQRFVQDEGERAFRTLQIETAEALEACDERAAAVELLLGANEPALALEAIARGGEAELERRPYEQLRHWVHQLDPSTESGRPWALLVSGVLGTRDSRFGEALTNLGLAEAALLEAGNAAELYEVLSVTEWAEFWSGDSAAAMATCHRALGFATTDSQRLHTLLSLLSAALDMRRWDEVASASSKADELLPKAKPQEAARAQALRAHAAFYQGDMHCAHGLIQGCHESKQTATQRSATLNTYGMIDIALGDYEAAARHLRDAATTADAFGHALTTHMIEDNIAFLEASMGHFGSALGRLRALQNHVDALDPTMLCFVLTHLGTALRRSGDLRASIEPMGRAESTLSSERDPYLALNAAANLAFARGLLGIDLQEALRRLSASAAKAGVLFVEQKALLFAAIIANAFGDTTDAIAMLENCLPRQLALGHINLVAQELCPRPELVSRVIRRHRVNGLGPALLEALSHHWLFPKTAATLKELGPTQIGTWLGHLNVEAPMTGLESERGRQARAPAARGGQPSDVKLLGQLSRREHDVLELMAQDRSNDQIAAELFIAVSTVKTHVNHILRKLGQTTRIGAVLEYQRLIGAAGHLAVHPGTSSSPPPGMTQNPPWV